MLTSQALETLQTPINNIANETDYYMNDREYTYVRTEIMAT